MEITKVNEQKYELYVLCYNDQDREERMIKRFKETGVTANICSFRQNIIESKDRMICGFFNQIAMMKQFYHHSDKEYGIFFLKTMFI